MMLNQNMRFQGITIKSSSNASEMGEFHSLFPRFFDESSLKSSIEISRLVER